jgi:hypothetical protein
MLSFHDHGRRNSSKRWMCNFPRRQYKYNAPSSQVSSKLLQTCSNDTVPGTLLLMRQRSAAAGRSQDTHQHTHSMKYSRFTWDSFHEFSLSLPCPAPTEPGKIRVHVDLLKTASVDGVVNHQRRTHPPNRSGAVQRKGVAVNPGGKATVRRLD